MTLPSTWELSTLVRSTSVLKLSLYTSSSHHNSYSYNYLPSGPGFSSISPEISSRDLTVEAATNDAISSWDISTANAVKVSACAQILSFTCSSTNIFQNVDNQLSLGVPVMFNGSRCLMVYSMHACCAIKLTKHSITGTRICFNISSTKKQYGQVCWRFDARYVPFLVPLMDPARRGQTITLAI